MGIGKDYKHKASLLIFYKARVIMADFHIVLGGFRTILVEPISTAVHT